MIRNITITSVLNGFSARVGCQTVVFTSVEALVSSLSSYLQDPDSFEKDFIMNAINAKHTLSVGTLSSQPEEKAITDARPDSCGSSKSSGCAPQPQPYF